MSMRANFFRSRTAAPRHLFSSVLAFCRVRYSVDGIHPRRTWRVCEKLKSHQWAIIVSSVSFATPQKLNNLRGLTLTMSRPRFLFFFLYLSLFTSFTPSPIRSLLPSLRRILVGTRVARSAALPENFRRGRTAICRPARRVLPARLRRPSRNT